MAINDASDPRPNDTPELEDELRSIRATGEGAGAPTSPAADTASATDGDTE